METDLTPESATLARDSSRYVFPDIRDEVLEITNYLGEHEQFAIKFGLMVLPADYTSFTQDDASKQQVGNQRDQFEVRALRLMARGHFELFRKWNYVLSYEYEGFEKNPGDPEWSPTDLRVSTDFEHVGTMTLGKMKEPFVYEVAGDTHSLPQSERLMNPFVRSRDVGMQFSNSIYGQRATWAAGWFNDWLISGDSASAAGNDFAARLTVLPIWSEDGTHYLHMGASVRYVGGDDNKLRFRGTPASHVADYYVDTGPMAADHAWNTGLEILWNAGGYSLLGEYVTSSVDATASGNPRFDGYYVTGSWVLTGEHRPYDRKTGYARRVLPQGRWGALELFARFGQVDLNDQSVHGGDMDGWWAGVNWWATRRWRLSVTFGDINLKRDGMDGQTRTWLSRVQWIH